MDSVVAKVVLCQDLYQFSLHLNFYHLNLYYFLGL
jgi:hypothetical protein